LHAGDRGLDPLAVDGGGIALPVLAEFEMGGPVGEMVEAVQFIGPFAPWRQVLTPMRRSGNPAAPTRRNARGLKQIVVVANGNQGFTEKRPAAILQELFR